MKRLSLLLLIVAASISSCSKYGPEPAPPAGPLPVTEAVKVGDWMVTLFDNSVQADMGLTFLKFKTGGTLVATKDGTDYNGTWTEANSNSNNTLTISITTTDTKLQRANRVWKVMGISEYFIDLKDPAVANTTVQLMKH